MADQTHRERDREQTARERTQAEGRPTGPTNAQGLRPGQDQAETATEAPEERRAAPDTEHAPGGDL